MGSVQLSAAEHAALIQGIMLLAQVPWSPLSGQPNPLGDDYPNYQVEPNGTILFTGLSLAGQPTLDDDGTFGTITVGKRGPAPKGIGGGGVDQGKGDGSSGPSVSTGSGTPASSAGSASGNGR